jgi:hypothetical protein
LAGKEFIYGKIPGHSKNKKLTFSDDESDDDDSDNDDYKLNDEAVVLRNIGNKNNDHYYMLKVFIYYFTQVLNKDTDSTKHECQLSLIVAKKRQNLVFQ